MPESNTHSAHEALRPLEPTFLNIGGLYVTVKDFVAIWNGEECLPTPTMEELQTAYSYSFFDYTWDTRDVSKALFKDMFAGQFNHGDVAARTIRYLMRLQKGYRLRKLIRSYREQNRNMEILRLDHVLAELSDKRMCYSDLAAALAAMGVTQPTRRDAEEIQHSMAELGGAGLESHYPSAENVRPCTEAIEDTRLQIACQMLGINAKKASGVPLFILEKAAFGHEPTADELRQISRVRNIGSAPVVHAIRAARLGIFLSGFAMFLGGIKEIAEGNPLGEEWIKTGVCFVGGGAWLYLLYPARAREISVSLASSAAQYGSIYQELAKRVSELQDTVLGKVQIAVLRQLALSAYADEGSFAGEFVDTVSELIAGELADPEIREEFEIFAARQSVDYDSPVDIADLLIQFRARRTAEASLEEELGEVHAPSIRSAIPTPSQFT